MKNRSACAAVVSLLALSVCGATPAVEHAKGAKEQSMMTLIDELVAATGESYLRLEAQALDRMRSSPEDATAVQTLLGHPDPMVRLLAQVLSEGVGDRRADFEKALEYLETLPIRLANTALGIPRADGTANYLRKHFGDRVCGLLTLRLMKESNWPRWKTMAVLLYVKDYTPPSVTTSAMLRYAIETSDREQRAAALATLRAMNDPELRAKLDYEIERRRKLGLDVPDEIMALAR